MLGAGMLIALGGLFFTLLSLQPVLVNQFAVDETGLTLTFLAPLSSRQIVLGKLVGGGILTAISTALCFLAGLVLVPAGHPLLWLATGVTAIASYLVFAPFCLLLSAVLPKTADLSRLGKDGNPQPVASFVATFGVPLVLAPPVLAVAVAVWVMESPLVGLVASLVWLGFAALVGREFLRAASAALSRRREAILLVATGR
jgi:hypothetical protein